MASESRTVIRVGAGADLPIAVTKFIAAYVSGSSAMFADGEHSLVDTGDAAEAN